MHAIIYDDVTKLHP